MDFRRPVSSIIPGATGLLLEALVRTTTELNLSTVAEIADVSPAQASRVLARLVEIGIVSRRDIPPSALFQLNRDHVAAKAIEKIFSAPVALRNQLRLLASGIRPPPANITLFGSAARGEADTSSDIDVLVVRNGDVASDDADWNWTLARWSEGVKRASGNEVNVLEVTKRELGSTLRLKRPPWSEILGDGITVFGTELRQLVDR